MGLNNYTFVRNKANVYCWGENDSGQLGLGDYKDRTNPVEFKIEENLSPIKQIICGGYHTFTICENNKIYCWGRNYEGQLGLGDQKETCNPVEMKIEGNSSPIKQIICGKDHTFTICENNKIYCWGENGYGQLGLGNFGHRNKPVEFKIEGNLSPIKQIVCGVRSHICNLRKQ